MLQTAQQRQREDFTAFRWFSGARMGAILVQRPMGAVAVKIVQILGQDTPQVLSGQFGVDALSTSQRIGLYIL